MSAQVAPPLHDTEHDAVQVTSHVAPLLQEALPDPPTVNVQCEPSQFTLPLGPVVIEHVLPPEQVAVHESLHVPLHEAALEHWSEQLPPLPLQLLLPVQVQLGPGHGPPDPVPELLEPEPHAARSTSVERRTVRTLGFIFVLLLGSSTCSPGSQAD